MPRILFVRSGGGLPGLDIHAGIWLAMAEAGILPTELAGTSAGSLVSAVQAAGQSASFFAGLTNSLCDSDVRREVLFWKSRFWWLDYYLKSAPVLSLLSEILKDGWEGIRIPFSAWATRLATGESVNVAQPSLSPSPALAALASMAISGVFEPVELKDGHSYVDGGVRCNLPLPDDWRSYDQVWLLIASGRPQDYARSHGILTALIRNVHYLMQDQIADVVSAVHGDPTVRVIWPQVHVTRGALHFDHRLISAAYDQTREILKSQEVQP